MTIRPGLVVVAAAVMLVPPSSPPTFGIAVASAPRTSPRITSVSAAPAAEAAREAVAGRNFRNVTRPRIVVTTDRAYRAGEHAVVRIVEENLGGDGEHSIDWGDGSAGSSVSGADFGCGGFRRGERHTSSMTHAYRQPGRWTVTVRFLPHCNGMFGTPIVGTAEVVVVDGDVSSNGPEQPRFYDGGVFVEPVDGAARTVAISARFEDYDGYLTRVAVHWGDGSPDTVVEYPLSRCHDVPSHWPYTYVSGDWDAITHTYARETTFRAVLTATTSGCDGKQVQTVTDDFLVRLPLSAE